VRTRDQAAAREQRLQQPHAELAGEVPIAGARVLQRTERLAQPFLAAAGALGDQRQRFQRARHVAVADAEIAVAPARLHRHQALADQRREMLACRGGMDLRGLRQLAGGQADAAHQRAQHAGARRVADGRRDAREARLDGRGSGHGAIVARRGA
jgi:hypothetical protein